MSRPGAATARMPELTLWLHDGMQVGVLGPLLVRADGRDVTPRSQRLRDVFVALLQRRGRPVPAETVLHLAWADDTDRPPVSAVHTTVARLRRQLGPDAIGSRDRGYLIASAVSTDADAFARLLAQARRQLEVHTYRTAADTYRAALALWRGPEPFTDIRSELVDTDRARLIELRALAVEELAALLLDHPDIGAPSEALALTGDLMTSQPLRERPPHLAMLAAYRCHRQAESLKIYRDLRQRLRTELGIEPTPATTALHGLILRQDPSLDGQVESAPRPAPAPRTPPTTVGRMPAPVSPLIGRERELSTVRDALLSGRRLVTLIGPGGVGKSRLLLDVGARFRADPDGLMRRLVYTEMSGLHAVGTDELAAAIAMQHGVLDPHRPALDALIDALGDDSWLLLVDEAEWVVEAMAGLATAVLESCPGAALVVTSRIPLDVAGETLVAVDTLPCPPMGTDPAAVRSTPAVQFLVQRLSDRAVPVGSDADTAEWLASIARRVDGLPLALELAAGQAAGRSLAEIAAIVDTPLDVAAAGPTRNSRHRSLRNTLQWSVNRLEARQRAVFRRLGVFVGRFDLAAAGAVAGGSIQFAATADGDIGVIVRSLARDALVHVERGGASQLNFRLLRTVRDLALEDLGPDELAVTRALHRRWHAGRWRAGGDDLVDDVREHLDDYVEALRSSLESRDTSTLADITLTLAQFWQFVGGQTVGLPWIARVLASDILDPAERAWVLAQRAALALHHDPALVLADTAAAIPLLESTERTAHTVTAISVRAMELLAQGRRSEAVAHADHAVEIARSRGAEELTTALGNQAMILAVLEQPDRASAAIEEAVDRLRSIPSTVEGVTAAGAIALALVNLERFDDAVALLDGIDLPPTATPPPARFQLTLGWASLGSGDIRRALTCFATAIPTPVRRRPADRHAAETVLGVACAMAALGADQSAGALAGALELLQRVDYRTPPALERAIARARRQVEHQVWPDFSNQQTADLLEQLERTLTPGPAGPFLPVADPLQVDTAAPRPARRPW